MFDWGVEGGEHVTGVQAVAAAPGADSFGLIALRQGRIARAFVAIGTLSVAVLYTAPFARALLFHPPARIHTLNPVVAPTLQFPALRIPAPLKAQPSTVKAPFATHARPHAASRAHRVPIVTSQVDLQPATAKPAAKTTATAPTPPIVDSSVGVEPAGFGVGAVPTDTTPAAATPAATDTAAAAVASAVAAATGAAAGAISVQAVPKVVGPASASTSQRTSCSCAPANTRLVARSSIANTSAPAPMVTLSTPPLPAVDPPSVTTSDDSVPASRTRRRR
jgi:hypothetical protein